MKRWLRFWRRLRGHCPHCGEELVKSCPVKSLWYLDCIGCGYYLHPESGYEHFPAGGAS